MIALPVATVPPEVKAPPAPVSGGQTVGTFSNHLATATSNQSASTATPSASNAAPSSATILPWRKFVLKSFAGANQATTSNAANAASAPIVPNALAGLTVTGVVSGNNPANSNASLSTGSTAGNTLLSSTALGAGNLSAAAIAAGANLAPATPSLNQSAAPLPNGAQSSLGLPSSNAAANPATIPTKASPASVLSLPANLVGQSQVSPQAATSAPAQQTSAAANAPGNQPSSGAPAPAVNQTTLLAASTANTGANPVPLPQTAAAGASPNAGATAANNAAGNVNAPQASTVNGVAQPAPSALDVNARVVAGAATLATHPTTASSAVAAQLLQSHDAGATTPTTTAQAVPGGKSSAATGIAAPTGSAATNGTIAAPSTANDARAGFSAALDRASATPAQTDSSSTSASSTDPLAAPAGDASTTAGATNATVLAAATPTPSNTSTPSATDMSLRPGMIALPASEQVAINLKQALANGSNEIQIQLKPASLGAIDVKLNVNHDGRLTAVISADRSDTLHLLKQDAGSLQQALQDAGFSADSGSLSFNLRSDTQGFAQNGSSSGYAANQPISLTDDAPAKLAAYAPRLHNGTIDIQA